MKSLNEVNLLGNMTREPELRYTPNGKAVVSFGLATNDVIKGKNEGEWIDVPEFHNIVFWGKAAEAISQYCHKGSKVFIKGRLKTRKYTNKANIEVYITEIIGRDISFLTPKPNNQPVQTDSAGNPVEDIIIPDDIEEAGGVESKTEEGMPF